VARNARRYGGLVALSGGLIGPDGIPRDYAGSLAGTPVFLGCSDVDPHIPAERVRHSAEVLAALDAEVDMRLYPGMGHTVNPDEMNRVQVMLGAPVEAEWGGPGAGGGTPPAGGRLATHQPPVLGGEQGT